MTYDRIEGITTSSSDLASNWPEQLGKRKWVGVAPANFSGRLERWSVSIADGILGLLGLKLTRKSVYRDALERGHRFLESEERARKLEFLVALSVKDELEADFALSQSQLGQDYFAFAASGQKVGGFFVEFGAVDGVKLSNTFLLEKCFGWDGILAEPNKRFFSELLSSRSVRLDNRAVGPESGLTLEFLDAGLNSSFYSLRDRRRWKEAQPTYSVETVSLDDLLREHSAPTSIDFMSIDTEGNEFATLASFDFGRYDISCICVEANGQESDLIDLLVREGYEQVFPNFSKWDLWFIKKDRLDNLKQRF